jgi:hypothetical protein
LKKRNKTKEMSLENKELFIEYEKEKFNSYLSKVDGELYYIPSNNMIYKVIDIKLIDNDLHIIYEYGEGNYYREYNDIFKHIKDNIYSVTKRTKRSKIKGSLVCEIYNYNIQIKKINYNLIETAVLKKLILENKKVFIEFVQTNKFYYLSVVNNKTYFIKDGTSICEVIEIFPSNEKDLYIIFNPIEKEKEKWYGITNIKLIKDGEYTITTKEIVNYVISSESIICNKVKKINYDLIQY